MIELQRFLDTSMSASEIASTPVVSCSSRETVRNSVAMTLNGFSRIMVTDRGELKGYLTPLDILDFLGAGSKYQLYVRYKKGLDLPVDTIMNIEWHPIESKHTVREALDMFHKHGKEFHPVMKKDRFDGVVSEMDFLRNLNKPLGFKTEEVMDRKPIVAKDHYTVKDVAKMLTRGEFRSLPVVKDGVLMGMITPRDVIAYLNKGPGLNNLRKADFEAAAAMNRNISTVEPGFDVQRAVEVMNKKNVNSVPVADEGELLGLISRRDVLDILS